MSRQARTRAAAIGFALITMALLAASCSSAGGDAAVGDPTASSTSTTTPVERPPGPAADLSEEITGARAPFLPAGSYPTVEFEEHEYVAVGTATSYQAPDGLPGDGMWTLTPADQAAYRTRVAVRAPTDPSRFSGTVVMEWLNVSAGLDAPGEYASVYEEIDRQGDIWVGVSAQQIGVLGGPVVVDAPGAEGYAGVGLKTLDPERYGTLEHPGDGYSYDIFTQVARAIWAGGEPTGGRTPERVIAVGQSQSAFALTTYANGVQPLTRAFDGFLLHSRGKAGLSLVGPGEYADIVGALSGVATTIRTDLGVPLLDIQTESDLLSPLNSWLARQPDSDGFRLWEVVGTAHADTRLIGPIVAQGLDCGLPVNDGPMHLVAKAALHALETWVESGEAPPTAPRVEISGEPAAIQRDPNGIALGGVRTPPVDVPTATLSSVIAPDPSVLCLLLGSTVPFTPAQITALYPSRTAYIEQFEEDADATISAGFVLPEDRAALLDYADPDAVSD